MPDDLRLFGSRLRWAIVHNTSINTPAELARVMEVKSPYISNLVKRSDPPGKKTLKRLSALLDVPEAWLAYGVTGEQAESGRDVRPDHTSASPDADVLRQLWARLDQIDRAPGLTPLQRSIKQERELAAYRASTQDREARIAEIRARTMEREADFAGGRTRALGGGDGYEVIEPLERDAQLLETLREELRDWKREMEKMLRAEASKAG